MANITLLHVTGQCVDHRLEYAVMGQDLTSSQLRRVLAEAADAPPGDPIVDSLMLALDKTKLFRYHNDEPVALLSTAGRVLMAAIEDPTMTQRAISVYLGCSESLVEKTLKTLTTAGLVTKTKVNHKNVYNVNRQAVETHSDIRHLARLLEVLEPSTPVDSDEPF